MKRWNISLKLLVVLTMTLFLLPLLPPKQSSAEGLAKFPAEATAKSLDGKIVSLSDYKGKLVFLAIWRTDCPPCLMEIPILNRLQKEYATDDFSVIGVSLDRGKDDLVNRIVEKKKISYPIWFAYDQPIAPYVDSQYTPLLLVIGPEGDILGSFVGLIPTYKDAVGFIRQAREMIGEHKAQE